MTNIGRAQANMHAGEKPRLSRPGVEAGGKLADPAVCPHASEGDFNAPLPPSDTNPGGVAVRTTADGDAAACNDQSHQLIFSQDGELNVLDRASPGSDARELSFSVKDGAVFHRNPNYKPGGAEPEFLRTEIPPEGMELLLSDGTTLFLEKNAEGTLDATVTNGDTMTRFDGVGSGQPWVAGQNITASTSGGAAFKEEWEATHDDGKKHGSPAKVWVTSMASPSPSAEHSDARRKQRKDGDVDHGQEPGGFSVRSDHRYDTNKGAGTTKNYLFYDLAGEAADPAAAKATLPEEARLDEADCPPDCKPACSTTDIEGVEVKDGTATYDDPAHQVLLPADGGLSVLDQVPPGSGELKENFSIKDGVIKHRNPSYTEGGSEPEFLCTTIPPEGMELKMSDGTTMFLEKNDDGTVDATITNATDGITRFTGIGSDAPWVEGKNITGGATGGSDFKEAWEANHDDGGKHGTPTRVWVTSMAAPAPTEAHEEGRRKQRHDGDTDKGQAPGGFSVRSDRRYDTNKGAGQTMNYLFYDLKGDAATPTEEAAPAAEPTATEEPTSA